MITLPAALQAAMNQATVDPVFVLEVMWNDGAHGAEGVNDVYFSTHDYTQIVGAPYPTRWFPVLDPARISTVSQQLDAVNGVSTIGSMTFVLTDYNKIVSQIIAAAESAGHGLRRQRCELYMLARGLNWATDKVKRRTLQVDDLSYDETTGQYTLQCADIQRNLKKTVFTPAVTYLAANMLATDTVMSVGNASVLTMLTQPVYGTAAFIKLEDEIMQIVAVDTVANTLTIGTSVGQSLSGRGMFGTAAVDHTIPTAGVVVSELVVLRGNPIDIALKMLHIGNTEVGYYNAYPPKWTAGLNPAGQWPDLDVPAFEALGTYVGYVPGDAASGIQYEFILDKGLEAKAFIEHEILRTIGGFSKVLGNGAYSCARMSDIARVDPLSIPQSNVVTINDVVSFSSLKYNLPKMVNSMMLEYREFPILSGKYVQPAMFFDVASIAKWGVTQTLRIKVKGIMPTAENINSLHARWIPTLARLTNPPYEITIDLPSKWFVLEVGDILRIQLPIADQTKGGADLDMAFEVTSIREQTYTGTITVALQSQPTASTVAALTSSFIGDLPPRSLPAAWNPAGSLQLSAMPASLGAIDTTTVVHFTGDITTTGDVNIAGNQIWWVEGVLNLYHHIIGVGTGASGRSGTFNANGWPYGEPPIPANQGFIGGGGYGCTVAASSSTGWWYSGTMNPPLYASPPIITPYLAGFTGSPAQATQILGLPSAPLWGGGGGSGAYNNAAPGGNGGAGLMIICKGINMGAGARIDLSGSNGLANVSSGGGGGGGTCIIMIELAAGGLGTTRIIDPAKFVLNGGICGQNPALAGYGYGTFGPWHAPQNGGNGALIEGVF